MPIRRTPAPLLLVAIAAAVLVPSPPPLADDYALRDRTSGAVPFTGRVLAP